MRLFIFKSFTEGCFGLGFEIGKNRGFFGFTTKYYITLRVLNWAVTVGIEKDNIKFEERKK